MNGFFDTDFSKTSRMSKVPRCRMCKLDRKCMSPRMEPYGKGERKILVVTEAPGEAEDEQNVRYVGKSWQLLDKMFDEVGYDLEMDCWVTSAVTCRPIDNRTPTRKEIDFCRPSLLNTIDELKPFAVILMGTSAVDSLLGSVWKKDIGGISRWAGYQIPLREKNIWACPIFHPSYVIRMENDVLDLWYKKHIKNAMKLMSVPWPVGPPDYEKMVVKILDHKKAAKEINKFVDSGKPVAFDYETDRLKPDDPRSKIASCAISDGVRTIAYPWEGDAVQASSDFLKSGVPKIAANIKFEERWTKAVLGHGVNNWKFDTMQASHVFNNEAGITSVKFQSFIRLGVGDYDSYIHPFLSQEGLNGGNRVFQADIDKLLLYNGMDAILEYQIAERQMKEVGIVL